MPKKSIHQAQFGDFQTPISLAQKIVSILKQNHHLNPDIIIEPTCGQGAFILAAYQAFTHATILGFEINPDYVKNSQQLLPDNKQVIIKQADFFNTDWATIIASLQGYLLIIGNPPWVTNSALSVLNGQNIPEKSNFHQQKGIEAITGSSNFDVSEFILLQLLHLFTKRDGTLAFLCKYAVARKVMRRLRKNTTHRLFFSIYLIDTKKYFSANVESCLLVVTTDAGDVDCQVYASLDAPQPDRFIGQREGDMVSHLYLYEKWRHLRAEESHYIWRSGIKHDCAKIMELEPVNGGYKNGLGEFIECETDYLYPLLKSSDLAHGDIGVYRKVVIVPQKFVGENTTIIKKIAPKTWDYLIRHKEYLTKRKSVIYQNKPEFSIFGVGDYSFKPWKIAISGLYKTLNFTLVGTLDGKTVLFDDTVNFLSFNTQEEALFIYELLTSEPALEFFNSIIFWDEKRPITIQLLKRLSLKALSKELGLFSQYQKWTEKSQLDMLESR